MTDHNGNVPRIIIVGGGAGGLELAIRLARRTRRPRRAEVVLVDCSASHVWKPRLHEIAAGLLALGQEQADYNVLAAQHGFDFVLGEACGIDVDARRIDIAATPYPAGDLVEGIGSAPMLPSRTLTFDIAVLAIGSTVNDFGIEGVKDHCYTLDGANGSERLNRALLDTAQRVKAGVQERLHVAIVGAGTTGVELASELRSSFETLPRFQSLISTDRCDITLLETADRVLPSSPERMSSYAAKILEQRRVELRLKATVERVEANRISIKGFGEIPADLIVWTSGIRSRELSQPPPGFVRKKGGRIAVDQTLHLVRDDGTVCAHVYGLGDCAAATDGKHAVPSTAQAAHQQARYLAQSLVRKLRGRSERPFRFHYRGMLVSLGSAQAVGDIAGFGGRSALWITGFGAKAAYASLYEAHLRDLFGLWRSTALRISQLFRRTAQPSFKLDW